MLLEERFRICDGLLCVINLFYKLKMRRSGARIISFPINTILTDSDENQFVCLKLTWFRLIDTSKPTLLVGQFDLFVQKTSVNFQNWSVNSKK